MPALLFVLAGFAWWHMLAPPARAQPREQPVPGYVMTRWGTADGLPHNSISALLQTRDGYLWIGTPTAGLVRFDGVTFKTFTILDTPGLPSDAVYALHEDAAGTLWIGTMAGLARYRDGVFSSERLGDDAWQNVVVDIREDREGRLWVAAHGRVVRRDGGEWTIIPTGADTVWRLSPSSDGTMWIATRTGLIEWHDHVVRTLTARNGLPADLVHAVHEDRTGRVWIGTTGGLAHLDRRAERAVVEPAILSDIPISTIFEDSQGVLWIGAAGRLFRLRPGDSRERGEGFHLRPTGFGGQVGGQVARAADGSLLASSFVNGGEAEPGRVAVFTEDREGHVWFGANAGSGGLYRLARERVSTLAHEEGLPCDNVGAITQAVDGTIWVATLCRDARGVIAIRDGTLTEYSGPTYPASLLAEPDGTVWVGTFGGRLFRFNGSRFEELPSPNRIGEDDITVLYRHENGALWLGTSRGLVTMHNGHPPSPTGFGEIGWRRLRVNDGLVSDGVRSIVAGAEGSVWIGTDAGISHYHDGRFTNYRAADGVPPGPVRAIHVDSDGVVWIGTYGGGLARFKDGVFRAYGVRNGVLDSSVHRILEDEDGFLWLTGDRGIRRAVKADLNAIADGRAVSLRVRLFDERDGMRSVECNGMAQPAGWRMRDGTFQFPTQRGVVRIDPARDTQTKLPAPPPHIEEALVDGAPSASGPEVVVPAGYREIEIRYTAPAFARPEQVQFRYRLDGYDTDWVEAGARRVAHYVNLVPGEYRFLVTARNNGGPWHEHAATVGFVLQPHVYQRLPFQIGLAVLSVLAAAGAVRWRIASLRHRARYLERAVADRTGELSIAHERLVMAKEEVEQAHGQVLAVLRQLDIGVLLLDARGTVRYVSTSAQRLLDKDAAALVGRPWTLCLPLVATDRAAVKARLDAASSPGGRVPVQMVLGGRRFWLEIDVQDEPRPGTRRILYMYNVTEVSTLPAGMNLDGPHGLVGRSTAMHLVYRQIHDVARVEATVLIEGETGAGKELVARAIHRESRRADRPFIAVNAAGLSESLLASQLFGHRRGAFTGAVADQVGVFEAANGGTVFLDEIGDIPGSMQVSLLRVLQEREITRIGESHARRLDVRFLAATHRDLAAEVASGRFREDLLYRIRVATIVVPPLRDRLDDLPLLVEVFLSEGARQADRSVPAMSRDAMEALMRHAWPGNVRELKSTIERALMRTSGDLILLDDLPEDVAGGQEPARTPAQALAASKERHRLVEALRRTGGNRAEAARLLGIGRSTLYRRLAAQGLDEGADP